MVLQVVSVDPANNATNVANNKQVKFAFNENINASTVTSSTVTVSPAVSISRSVSGLDIFVTPTTIWAASTTYSITIHSGTSGVKATNGDTLASNFVLSFTTAPAFSFSSSSPANGATNVGNQSNITVTFTNNVDSSTVSSSTLTISPSVSGTWSTSGKTVTINPSGLLAASTSYTVTATTSLKDTLGQVLSASHSFSFTTAAALVVNSTVPANGATNVPNSQVISITFNNNIDSGTVSSSTVTASPSITGTWATSNNVVTITPTSNLSASTTYTITATTSVFDIYGQVLASSDAFSFTTAPAFTVTSTNPANNATNVALNQLVTMVFSNNLTSSTVNATNITVSPANSSATVAIDGVNANQADMNPNGSTWALNTTYTVTVSTSVQDIYGQVLSSSYSFSFTTVNVFEVTGNTPANGATNVALNVVPTVTFDFNIANSFATPTYFSINNGVTVTVSGGGTSTITLTPTANLAFNTTYTVTVSSLVQDTNNDVLGSTFTFSFTTIPPGLVVTGNFPTNGANYMPQNTISTITFNNNLNSSTVNTTNVTISPAVGGDIVTLSPNNQINLDPNGPNLVLNTTYTVTVSTSVQDVFSQSLSSAFSFSFTVAVPPFVGGGKNVFVAVTRNPFHR